MTDTVQINTLDEELEWEEWKGVRIGSFRASFTGRTYLSGGMPLQGAPLVSWNTSRCTRSIQ